MRRLEELNQLEGERRNLMREADVLDRAKSEMAEYRKQKDIFKFMQGSRYGKGPEYLNEVLAEHGYSLMRLAEIKMELDAKKKKVEAEVIKGQIQASLVRQEVME